MPAHNSTIANQIAVKLSATIKDASKRTGLVEALAAFDRDDFAEPPPDPPPKKQAATDGQDPPEHVDEESEPRFVWGGAAYAPNGARYIANGDRKDKYSSFDHVPLSVRKPVGKVAAFNAFVFNFNPAHRDRSRGDHRPGNAILNRRAVSPS